MDAPVAKRFICSAVSLPPLLDASLYDALNISCCLALGHNSFSVANFRKTAVERPDFFVPGDREVLLAMQDDIVNFDIMRWEVLPGHEFYVISFDVPLTLTLGKTILSMKQFGNLWSWPMMRVFDMEKFFNSSYSMLKQIPCEASPYFLATLGVSAGLLAAREGTTAMHRFVRMLSKLSPEMQLFVIECLEGKKNSALPAQFAESFRRFLFQIAYPTF